MDNAIHTNVEPRILHNGDVIVAN
ncbi:LEPR-XLL domain-containing protein [Paraflavitalea soli]|uniref:LEPR-XLL domain-containing protein n=1 Tax=Paraflavitalea soli TaxID=2315862 RepID=A0A3B7N024_9BACT|nr:LEPR-XLL domain-containing protein [Paraflavitalea soli]